MSESDSAPFPRLPPELERALQQATSRTFASLATLRESLRQHVRTERKQGATFPEIEADLRLLIARVEAESHAAAAHLEESDSLSDRVVKWSEVFFGQADL
jgi:hypothetical protein